MHRSSSCPAIPAVVILDFEKWCIPSLANVISVLIYTQIIDVTSKSFQRYAILTEFKWAVIAMLNSSDVVICARTIAT